MSSGILRCVVSQKLTDISQVLTGSIMRASKLIALMTEAGITSETSVNFYETTRRSILEDSHLQNRELLNKSLSLLMFPHESRHTGIVPYNRPRPSTVQQFKIILSSIIHRRQYGVKLFSLFKFSYGQLWSRRELSNLLRPLLVPCTIPTSPPVKEIRPVLSAAVFQISIVYCLAVLQDKTNSNSHHSFFLQPHGGGGYSN
jgi:hypothetical protein